MTRTRVKTDPSVRTYYLLFDGKTLTTKRPDVKTKAIVRASSAKEAREKLATRFIFAMGRFGSKITQKSRALPTDQPTMKDKVRLMAAADAKNSEPIDLAEVLELANRELANRELAAPKTVVVTVQGITLTLQAGSFVDSSIGGIVTVGMPNPVETPAESDLG